MTKKEDKKNSLKDAFKPLNFDENIENSTIQYQDNESMNELSNTSIKLPKWMLEKIRDYNYWNAIAGYDEIALEAFTAFFEGKDVKPRPNEVKQREKLLYEKKMKSRKNKKK